MHALLASILLCQAFPSFESSVLLVDSGAQALKYSYERNNLFVVEKGDTVKIPKIIHQIWIGGPLPEAYRALGESWKRMNPGWEYKLWTDADIEGFPFINRQAFDKATNLGMKSDIWRYEILSRYGGVYVDTDFECLKPLSDLHCAHEFYAGCLPDGAVANGLIGSVPNHPILKWCIEEIGANKREIKTPLDIQNATGPFLLTRNIVKAIVEGVPGVIAYPASFFYPLEFSTEVEGVLLDVDKRAALVEQSVKPESFAIHYFARSWVKEIQNKSFAPSSLDSIRKK